MAVHMAMGAIKSIVDTKSELTNLQLLQCTEGLIGRMGLGTTIPTERIEMAICANAGVLRMSFETFSLDVLPIIWSDLGLVDLSQDAWEEVKILIRGHELKRKQTKLPQNMRRSSSGIFQDACSATSRLSPRTGLCSPSFAQDASEDTASINLSSLPSVRDEELARENEQLRQMLQKQKDTIELLSSCLQQSDCKLAEARCKLRVSQQTQRRTEEKLTQVEEDLKSERSKRMHEFMISKTSDIYKRQKVDSVEAKWEWLTPQGCLSLGIRKCLSNISRSDLGITLCDDISRWTVARQELKVSACMVADSWKYFYQWRVSCHDEPSNNFQPCTIISFRQDRTNSGIWNRSKLIALELETAYKVDIPCNTGNSGSLPSSSPPQSYVHDALQNWHRLKRLSDVQIVKWGSGRATLALTQKMLEALRCPHWGDTCPGQYVI